MAWTDPADVIGLQPFSAAGVNLMVRDNLLFLRERTQGQRDAIPPEAARLATVLSGKPRWESTPAQAMAGALLTTNALGRLEAAWQERHINLHPANTGGNGSLGFTDGAADDAPGNTPVYTGQSYAVWSAPRARDYVGAVRLRMVLSDYRSRGGDGHGGAAQVRWGFMNSDGTVDWRGDVFNHTYQAGHYTVNTPYSSGLGFAFDTGWVQPPAAGPWQVAVGVLSSGRAVFRCFGIGLTYRAVTGA